MTTTGKRWLTLLLLAGLIGVSAVSSIGADEIQSLIQQLDGAKGPRLIDVLGATTERYDPRFIQPLVNSASRGQTGRAYKLIRQELNKYGHEAEEALTRFLGEEHPEEELVRVIQLVADLQAASSTAALLELAAHSEGPTLTDSVDRAMLAIGDLAAADLARLSGDPALGQHAIQYLRNTVSIPALRWEAEKRAGTISTQQWAEMNSRPSMEVTNQLLQILETGQLSTEPRQEGRGTSGREELGGGFPWGNLLMVAGVLAALAILWGLVKASRSVPGGDGRKAEVTFNQIHGLITEKRWDEAMTLLNRAEMVGADQSTTGAKRKVLKGQILLGRAQKALKEFRFDQAEDDFEHYCNLSGESPEHYFQQIHEKRLAYQLDVAQEQYVSGATREATATVEELLALDYTFGPAHLLKALIALEEGRPEEAAVELHHAAEYISQSDASVSAYHALAMERSGDPEAALSLLGQLEDIRGYPLAALTFVRCAAATQTQVDQAIRLAEYLEDSSATTEEMHPRGTYMGELEQKYRHKDRIAAPDLLRFEAACHYYLGRLLQAQGDRTGRAQRELAQAKEMGFEEPRPL